MENNNVTETTINLGSVTECKPKIVTEYKPKDPRKVEQR